MSLDISKLRKVRTRGTKVTAQCPACAESGHDSTNEHLIIYEDGRFGCVVYPGVIRVMPWRIRSLDYLCAGSVMQRRSSSIRFRQSPRSRSKPGSWDA